MTCARCGTVVPASRLSCPACHSLVHAGELKSLALAAEAAAANGDVLSEITSWRRALELLPPGTRQFESISAKVSDLSRRLDEAPAAGKPEGGGKGWKWGGLTAVGLFILTKGKLLLLGLTNAGTLFTMALSFGVYWKVFGWPFAAGLIVSVYIHEMGHVAALRRFGIRGSLPTFLPGIGAVVRLQQHPANAVEDARVGLAGPLWGMGAAIAAWLAFLGGGWPLLAAIARFGAWINLFNLLPIWQLDGGRAFRALSRGQRIVAAVAMGALWLWTREGLLVLLGIVALLRVFGEAPAEGDRKAAFQYLLLLIVLSAMCLIEVPIGTAPL